MKEWDRDGADICVSKGRNGEGKKKKMIWTKTETQWEGTEISNPKPRVMCTWQWKGPFALDNATKAFMVTLFLSLAAF